MDSINANPFAIFQFALWREPSRAMAREFACDLVESESATGENTSLKYDFLDFHAAPFALAIAESAIFKGTSEPVKRSPSIAI
jgi:hypothetical protein